MSNRSEPVQLYRTITKIRVDESYLYRHFL